MNLTLVKKTNLQNQKRKKKHLLYQIHLDECTEDEVVMK